ncbi:MAG: GNAT family N-acetyltransferase [Clostridiaceae bacterium]|nr:GNAT family N-acetyltransferase [Clostridiaceae bacterium]
MIKKAEKNHYETVVNYLDKGGSINTALLSFIEKYGFEKDFLDIWVYNDNDDNENIILAVIMRYFNFLYIYNEDSLPDKEELGFFASFMEPEIVLGKTELLNDISTYFHDMYLESSTHMVLTNNKMLRTSPMAEKARYEDCREMADLIYSIPDFARFYHSSEEIEKGIRRRMEMGVCRYFVIRKNGKIVSQAYTTTECSKYATIGGVVTRNEYRNQGLASFVVSNLCEDILKDNKLPNLFYNNMKAGRVYESLGFVPSGDYAMLLRPKYRHKQT